jgi:hypothetical protein
VPKKLMPALVEPLHARRSVAPVKLKAMPLTQVMVNRVLIPFIALPSYQGRVPALG